MCALKGVRVVSAVVDVLLEKAMVQQDKEAVETFRDLADDLGMLMAALEEVDR